MLTYVKFLSRNFAKTSSLEFKITTFEDLSWFGSSEFANFFPGNWAVVFFIPNSSSVRK